jgi:hypothetical protein
METQYTDAVAEMDFAALLHYPGPAACESAIHRLERGSPFEMRKVLQVWHRAGDFPMNLGGARWFETFDEGNPVARPAPVSIQSSLETREGFSLTFGRDAVLIYHPLRWQSFLAQPEWSRVMLLACAGLGRELGADEFIVTRDEGPAVLAFLRGMNYSDCLRESSQHEREIVELERFLEGSPLALRSSKKNRRSSVALPRV